VTENTEDKNRAAEERSQDTRRLVRQVRSATRRKYTPEEKIHIVLQGFRREVTANELCRREGIKPANFYSWTKEFMEAGKQRLSRDTTRDATRQEIDDLKRESADLKVLVAELSLDLHRLKKTTIPTLDESRPDA
jgi:transposase